MEEDFLLASFLMAAVITSSWSVAAEMELELASAPPASVEAAELPGEGGGGDASDAEKETGAAGGVTGVEGGLDDGDLEEVLAMPEAGEDLAFLALLLGLDTRRAGFSALPTVRNGLAMPEPICCSLFGPLEGGARIPVEGCGEMAGCGWGAGAATCPHSSPPSRAEQRRARAATRGTVIEVQCAGCILL
jgi:hypothetical protein